MSNYNPPTENITEFNTSLFNQPEVILSQAEADLLYLSKTKNDISTATLTTFNNQVNVGTLNTISIKSSTPASSSHTLFDNMTSGGNLTIGNMTPNVGINLKGAVSVGQSGTAGGTLTLYRKLNIQDINGNATGFGELVFGSAPELGIYAISVPATLVQTFVRLYSCTAGSTTSILRFEVGDITKIFNPIEVSSRLSFTGASYSFPFASNQSLGYVLKNLGTGFSITSNTATTASTIAIPIGVWRVDFSVQNTVGTAGTITSAQSYVATSAAPTTQLGLTGSLIRTHVSEAYGIGDIQVVASSFTLSVSTAQNYVLTVLRTFATGAYTIVGEITITRLA